MKKSIVFLFLCAMALSLYAVPARRGWQTRTQADGTTIEVQQMGDEFYHYLINRDGKQVCEIDGMYVEVGDAPTRDIAKARRAKAVARRQRKEFGKTPNMAPKGVVILVNFNDVAMANNHTKAVFDSLCNAKNCLVNSYAGVNYPSAAQYFKDQSHGAYCPQFDVFGPVTLSKGYAYYGQNIDEYGNETTESGDGYEDHYATDAVIEACILANQKYANLNFADYDSDNDGKVDFVYVVYAGKGEASGGNSKTIWPHSYEISNVVYPFYYNQRTGEWVLDYQRGERSSCCYTEEDVIIDGKELNSYAMSSELDYSDNMDGIGTLCHEFGHVMGLPDFYDTEYGDNYANAVTPNDWDVMDGGAYNGGGHCPPNYSAWEKEFFGWHTSVNLGNEGKNLTLYANGTDNYQAYQITTSGNYVGPTASGVRYYIENRQAIGWDSELPHHGMLLWKVNYNATAWSSNVPNNGTTSGSPLYTIVSASGTKIGSYLNDSGSAYVYDGPKNPFPGSKNVTSYTGISGKPLKNIKESNQLITLTYIEEPVIETDPFNVTWMSNGKLWATTQSTGTLILPDAPEACTNGKVFVGWCAQASYESATTAPTFVQAGDAVSEGAVFYAVFADKNGEGDAQQTTTYTFTTKDWGDATNSWTSNQDGYGYVDDKQGVQVTAGTSGAKATTKNAASSVSKIVVSYCTNASKGEGSIAMTVGSKTVSKDVTKTGGASLRDLEYTFDKASGKVAIEVTCTTNSIYVHSVAVTAGGGVSYANYSTSCGSATDHEALEMNATENRAQKVIRNGQLIIVRDGIEYNAIGVRIQ